MVPATAKHVREMDVGLKNSYVTPCFAGTTKITPILKIFSKCTTLGGSLEHLCG